MTRLPIKFKTENENLKEQLSNNQIEIINRQQIIEKQNKIK